MARAIEAIGKECVIAVEEGESVNDSLELVEGTQFDRGCLSAYCVTDPDTSSVALERPYILLYDEKIQSAREFLPLLEAIAQSGRSLLVIADDLSSEALALLVVNSLRGTVEVAAVKAPGFGDRRKAMLEDLAVLIGGKVISAEVGQKLENVTLEDLGTARSVRISKDTTTIVDGGDPSVVLSTVCRGTNNFGFNAAIEEFGDLVKMGIVDPAKVTRLALHNAASIVGLLLATEAAVVSVTRDASHAAGMEGAM